MPMDNITWQETADQAFKRRCIGWELKFSLLPRRCYYTGKYLWFKFAYIGVSMLTGPGEPMFDYRWCDRKEYLFLKIKGTI
jgi:hypothetical protein